MYGISWLTTKNAVRINKWITFFNSSLNYTMLPFFGGGIKNKIIVNEYEKISMADGNADQNRTALRGLAELYIKSMNSITQYNKALDDYDNPSFNGYMFESSTSLFKILKNHYNMFLLCSVFDHSAVRKRNGKFCYVFNCNTEISRVSIIKWIHENAKTTKHKSIKIGEPVIFGHINFQTDIRPHFTIKDNSFIIYNFCTDIINVLSNGTYDNIICSHVNYLWPHVLTNKQDHLFYKQIIVPQYGILDEATKYTIDNIEDNKSAIFKIMSSSIKSAINESAQFKIYCDMCRSTRIALSLDCCVSNGRVRRPWLDAHIEISWEYDKKESLQKFSTLQTHHDITLGLDSMQMMYNYLADQDVEEPQLNDYQDYLLRSFKLGHQCWQTVEQSAYYLPLIKTFFTVIQDDKQCLLEFTVTQKRINSMIYQRLKLRSVSKVINPLKRKLSNDIPKILNSEPNTKKQKTNTQ